jgi:hypothetical protein
MKTSENITGIRVHLRMYVDLYRENKKSLALIMHISFALGV